MGKVTRQIMCHCTTKMGRLGFEPRTNRLKAEYSTVELATPENCAFCTQVPIVAQF